MFDGASAYRLLAVAVKFILIFNQCRMLFNAYSISLIDTRLSRSCDCSLTAPGIDSIIKITVCVLHNFLISHV